MELAGSTCAVCGQYIVLAREGKWCPACARAVHQACDPRSQCARCGGDYALPRLPASDPLRDAILPRRLRPDSGANPVAVLFLGLLLFLFFCASMIGLAISKKFRSESPGPTRAVQQPVLP